MNAVAQSRAWNAGATFIGIHAGVKYYARGDKIICLFGWRPMEFNTIRSFKIAVTRWENEQE